MAQTRDFSQEVILFLLPTDIPQDYQTRLQRKFPGVTARWHNMLSPATREVLTWESVPRHLFDGVTILCAQRLPPAEYVPKCHLIQLTAAGPDKSAQHPLFKDPKATVCSANGVHPPQIAEWAIGTWIAHRHHFKHYMAQQQRGYWPTNYKRATAYVEDSPGGRMGILGYGAIGRQVERLAKAMGMDVVAFTARERPTPESKHDKSYCVPGTGDPTGEIPSRWFHGGTSTAIDDFLAQDIDVLFMALPLTSSTTNIISEKQFDILSKTRPFIINVGRGAHIDTEALMAANAAGKIRGAALDVTDPEPLPADHPLWHAPNIFITPHVSWQTERYFVRVMDIVEQNLERLVGGQDLLNVIDKSLYR